MHRRRLLLVWSGPETGTSANLFKALGRILAEGHEVREGPNDIVPGTRMRRRIHMIVRELRRWPQVIRSEAVILHSYIALSLPTILLAWALRKEIIVVHWDVYPITLDGQRLGGGFRAMFDRIEQFALRLATRVVLPTEDFAPFVQHANVRFLPLWPSLPLGSVAPKPPRNPTDPIRVAFVGQTNVTRGLPQSIIQLSQAAPTMFELHIFSSTPPEPSWASSAPNVHVVTREFLAREALITALTDMDFGLISLHPGMGQPGFPSKVFDYVAAGLPVIYTGRSLPAFEALLKRTGVGVSLRDSPLNWDVVRVQSAEGISAAASAFAAETSLTLENVEQAFFSEVLEE